MKILIYDENAGAHTYQRLGLGRALAYAGHNVGIWNPGAKSAFDVFSEIEPDLFIGEAYKIDRALMKCLLVRKNLKIVLKAGDYGPFYSDWTQEKHSEYPILMSSEQEINSVRQLRDNGNLSYLMIHYHPDYIYSTHGFWFEKEGVHVSSSMNACDLFEYANGQFLEELSCDCSIVGGSWKYKSQTIDRWLLPLCNPNLNLNIKIFGKMAWGVPQYCGPLPTGQAKNLFRSTTVNLNVHEKHSQDFGFDLNERTFKVLGAKGFMVSDYVEGLSKLYSEDELVMTKSPAEYKEKISYFMENPSKRHKYVAAGYKRTLANHTYFDRVIDMFNNLGWNSKSISEAKEKLIKELKL